MNVTKQLYQWDTGQKLTECTGIYVDYLIGDEVYRVEIIDGTCIIPDELLQTSGRYKVWECMADNTLREFAFKVLPRPVPPNYVFTPTEQLTFEGLVQKETNKFNTNAIEKLNAYNANADNRVAEFNAHTEQIQADVSELKSDLTTLSDYLDGGVPISSFLGLVNDQGVVISASSSRLFVIKAIPNTQYTLVTADASAGSAFYIAEFFSVPSVGSVSKNFSYNPEGVGSLTLTTSNDAKYLAIGKGLITKAGNFSIGIDRNIADLFNKYDVGQTLGEKIYITDFVDGQIVMSSGITQGDASGMATQFIEIHGYPKMRIVMPIVGTSESDWGLMFYTKDKTPILNSFNRTFVNRTNAYVTVLDVYVPQNAYYFRTSMWSKTYAQEHHFSNELWYILYEDKPITHKPPINAFAENVVKRAYQYVDIKWTPISVLPRYSLMDANYSGEAPSSFHFLDKFDAEKEYVGLPYSFSGRLDYADDFGYFALTVGHFVPFESFITSLRYDNSIMYDKAIFSNTPQAVPYGADCMALVAYAFNWTYRENSWDDVSAKATKVGNVPDLTSDQLMPADIMISNGHIMLITDVMTVNGTVLIETCEETTLGNANNTALGTPFGGVGKRQLWNEAEFFEWFKIYSVYRVRNIFNIDYTPNPYAPIDGENDRKPLIDFPCIPYMGNKFAFKYGYIPNYASKVLIGANGFSKIVVEKDGVQFDEQTITDQTTEVTVTFSAIGTYTAYLVDANNNKSHKCEWYVVA